MAGSNWSQIGIPEYIRSNATTHDTKHSFSEFEFNHQSYTLNGNETKTVPTEVATAWAAANSNVTVFELR